MNQYVTTNITRPTEKWWKARRWYWVLSIIISIGSGIFAFIYFLVLSESFIISAVGSVGIGFISTFLGVFGGIIGNGFRHMVHPKSIRLKNPSLEELVQTKLYWLLQFQLVGIIFGSILPVALLSEIAEKMAGK